MALFDWLMFWGVCSLLVPRLRTVHDNWGHYTITEITVTFYSNFF